jgi:predicted glycosyltransferase
MKILFDIKHPAQLNLFKGLSAELQDENWEVTICYLQRGKLPNIIKLEYPGFKTIPVGSSKGTRWSILWHGNVIQYLCGRKQYPIGFGLQNCRHPGYSVLR